MDDTVSTIQSVRKKIAESEFAKYMEGKPIGHTDTAPYAVVKGSDFAGMNAYPYWTNTSISDAGSSFMGSLEDTQRRAGDMPVWITEMGWPIKGANNTNDTLASVDNYRRYWSEVGCQIFGKYNTFWFELLQDSQPEQPDWGLLDTKTFQPRIPDLSCGGNIANSVSAKASDVYTAMVSPSVPPPATLSTVPTPAFNESASECEAPTVSPTSLATAASAPLSPPLQTTQEAVSTRTSTVRVTRTTTITLAHPTLLTTNNAAVVTPPTAPLETSQTALNPLETTQPAPPVTVYVTHTSIITIPLTSTITVAPSSPVATSDEAVVTPPPTLTSPAAVAPLSSPVAPPSAVAPPSSAPQNPAPPSSPIPTTPPYAPSAPQNSPPITGTATCTANPADTVCIVMMDMMGDGVFIPVATHASDVAACKPPPRFRGEPLTMIAEGSSSTLPEGGSESACEASSV
jgi:hypothetical protein